MSIFLTTAVQRVDSGGEKTNYYEKGKFYPPDFYTFPGSVYSVLFGTGASGTAAIPGSRLISAIIPPLCQAL